MERDLTSGECFSECDLFFATLFFILFFTDALWDGGSFYCWAV
mgnify:CR=1 FL=1